MTTSTYPETFGSCLKTLRESRGVSQVELAKALGFHKSTICKWEHDDLVPDLSTDFRERVVEYLSYYKQVPIEERQRLREAHIYSAENKPRGSRSNFQPLVGKLKINQTIKGLLEQIQDLQGEVAAAEMVAEFASMFETDYQLYG